MRAGQPSSWVVTVNHCRVTMAMAAALTDHLEHPQSWPSVEKARRVVKQLLALGWLRFAEGSHDSLTIITTSGRTAARKVMPGYAEHLAAVEFA